MLHAFHQDRNYIAALEADRLRAFKRGWRPDDRIEHVVAAAERGDQSAWAALVARFRGHIIRVARAHGLRNHEADDVLQETCLRLYRNLSGVREPHSLGAWVDTAARYESLRVLRKGRLRREELTDSELDFAAPAPQDSDDDDLMEERRAALAQALTQMPASQRTLMQALLADPAPSYAEVSARLGIPIGSIGPTRGRCLTRLRGALAPELARSGC
jgi:RNA polymerase sigma factor (sigma-70 family)